MPRSIAQSNRVLLTTVAIILATSVGGAQEKFKKSGSERPYTHLIALYDADGVEIDPSAPDARPYSPRQTCMKCHDVAKIAGGTHFVGSSQTPAGRPGEPFIWVDRRTGTQIPLSFRGWPGTYTPEQVGLDAAAFVSKFGRHLPGTGFDTSDRDANAATPEIDCLFCHVAGHDYRHSKWIESIESGQYEWAPSIALGLANSIAGETAYDPRRFDPEGKVFIDVVRRTPNAACYACHTTRVTGSDGWLHDGDVHLRAGLLCVDCHRNGLDHQTVRGFPGETHPGGTLVATLTCRGCHLDTKDDQGHVIQRGGRLGAPKPLHRGLPPLHLEKMSCTSCHSGTRPSATGNHVQTSLAHGLGVASQDRTDADPPLIVEPVLLRDADGLLRPHRMMWPSFWGWLRADDTVVPISPRDVVRAVRRAFRVRRDLAREVRPEGVDAHEWETQFDAKRIAALESLRGQGPEGARPVLVSGGRMYVDEKWTPHDAARPYSWPVAHDVRPARESLGANGCEECHSAASPLIHAVFSPSGPAPVAAPTTLPAHELAGLDAELLSAWEESFEARDLFKILATSAFGVIAVVLLIALFTVPRPRRPRSTGSPPPSSATAS